MDPDDFAKYLADQAHRLLRRDWTNPTQLAQELYSMLGVAQAGGAPKEGETPRHQEVQSPAIKERITKATETLPGAVGRGPIRESPRTSTTLTFPTAKIPIPGLAALPPPPQPEPVIHWRPPGGGGPVPHVGPETMAMVPSRGVVQPDMVPPGPPQGRGAVSRGDIYGRAGYAPMPGQPTDSFLPTGQSRAVGVPPAGDTGSRAGPKQTDDGANLPRDLPYSLQMPLSDVVPMPAEGGTSLLGQVVSGSGNTYSVQLYPSGPNGPAGDTVTVVIPQIDSNATLPEGTWLNAIGKATNEGAEEYWCQIPIWLSDSL